MSRRAGGLGLVAVLGVGFCLRAYRLGDVPFGLHPDEGHNALDALRILEEGWRPVFLPGNNGREPLFMYLMAATMRLFGETVRGVRAAGVVAGVAAVAAQALLVRTLPVRRPGYAALFSAAVVAVTFWPVAQARYALRAGLLPVWVSLMLWAWWRSLGRDGSGRRLVWSAAAGVFLAGALYTHLTGRVLILILLAHVGWLALRGGGGRAAVGLAAAFAVAAMLTTPLWLYFADHPEMLTYRMDQVSLGATSEAEEPGDTPDSVLTGLLENSRRLLEAPLVKGDSSWYHNLSGRPIFDIAVGLAFLIGLAYAAADLLGRRGREAQSAAILLAAALAVTTAPSLLSVGAPNYVRLTAVWPVLFLLPGVGLERIAAFVDGKRTPPNWDAEARPAAGPPTGRARRLGLGTAAATTLLAAGAWLTTRDLFTTYAEAPETFAAFNGAALERGYHVAQASAAGILYVTPALWNQSVIRFAAHAAPPRSVDPLAGTVWPESGPLRCAFDPVEADRIAAFARRWRAKPTEIRGRNGELALALFDLGEPAEPPPAPGASGRVFGEHLELLAWEAPAAVRLGEVATIRLGWRVLKPTALDHNLFIHLDAGAGTAGQLDGPPLDGSYGTNQWHPGEVVWQPFGIPVRADAPVGPATIRVGWYDWRTGQRLPFAGSADGSADLGTIEVVAAAGEGATP